MKWVTDLAQRINSGKCSKRGKCATKTPSSSSSSSSTKRPKSKSLQNHEINVTSSKKYVFCFGDCLTNLVQLGSKHESKRDKTPARRSLTTHIFKTKCEADEKKKCFVFRFHTSATFNFWYNIDKLRLVFHCVVSVSVAPASSIRWDFISFNFHKKSNHIHICKLLEYLFGAAFFCLLLISWAENTFRAVLCMQLAC